MGALTSCRASQRVVDNCFPQNATIKSVLSGDFFVGYAHIADIAPKKNPTSPTIVLENGEITSGPNALRPGETSLGGITTYNQSVFDMKSGYVNGYVEAKHHSKVMMHGGKIGGTLQAYDTATVEVTGGTVLFGLLLHDKSVGTIRGGEVIAPWLGGHSTLTIEGGKPSMSLTILEHATVHLRAWGDLPSVTVLNFGTLNIYGVKLQKTLVDSNVSFGHARRYALSGTLADGTDLAGKIIEVSKDDKPVVRLIETSRQSITKP